MNLTLKSQKIAFLEKNMKFIKNYPELIAYYDYSSIIIKNIKEDKEIFTLKLDEKIKDFHINMKNSNIKIILIGENNITIKNSSLSSRKISLKGIYLSSYILDEIIYIVTSLAVYKFESDSEYLQDHALASNLRKILINDTIITDNYFIINNKSGLSIYNRKTENLVKVVDLKLRGNNFIKCFDARENDQNLDLVLGMGNGEVLFYLDFLNSNRKGIYKWHAFEVECVCFSKNRKVIFSGGKERVMVMYEIEKNYLDFLPRFESTLKNICSDENEEFLIIELENGESRLIETQTFKTLLKCKNLNPLLKTRDFDIKKRNCGILRVDEKTFEIVENFDSKIKIFNFNPSERNTVINPNKSKTEYIVDNIETSYDLRFICTSEYLKRNDELIFSKLKFFFYDKENQQMRNLGIFNNSHLNNKIKKIVFFFDKVEKKNIFITFCDSFIKFWKIHHDLKKDEYNFKCVKTLKNRFFNLTNIFAVNKIDVNYLLFDLEEKTEIFTLNQNFELEQVGVYNLHNIKNIVFNNDSLLFQTEKDITLLNLESNFLEKNIKSDTNLYLEHLNKNICLLWFNTHQNGKILFMENNIIKKVFEAEGKISHLICSKHNIHIFDSELNFYSLFDKEFQQENQKESNFYQEFFNSKKDQNLTGHIEKDIDSAKIEFEFEKMLEFNEDSLILPNFKIYNTLFFDKVLTKNR